VRGSGVDVYKNTEDGLADEGLSLRLRTPGGAAFTPQKALLARGEVRARWRCALLAVLSLKMHARHTHAHAPTRPASLRRPTCCCSRPTRAPRTARTASSSSVRMRHPPPPPCACMHACVARVLTQLAFRAPKRRH
jgi:hypothetical protein